MLSAARLPERDVRAAGSELTLGIGVCPRPRYVGIPRYHHSVRRIAWLALVGGCLEPTEIELDITTNMTCKGQEPTILSTEIWVGAEKSSLHRVASTEACRERGTVGSIFLLPHGKESSYVVVRAKVLAGAWEDR